MTNPQIRKEIEKLSKGKEIETIRLYVDNSDDIVTIEVYLTFKSGLQDVIRLFYNDIIHITLYENGYSQMYLELKPKLEVISLEALNEAEKTFKYLSKYYEIDFNHIVNHV